MEWVERNRVEPWVIVDLAEGEEAARRILSRSISAKYCIQGFELDKKAGYFERWGYPQKKM